MPAAILKSKDMFPPDPEGELNTTGPRLTFCFMHGLGLVRGWVGNFLCCFRAGVRKEGSFVCLMHRPQLAGELCTSIQPRQDPEQLAAAQSTRLAAIQPLAVCIASPLQAFAVYKIYSMGLLPTNLSDWVSSMRPPTVLEHAVPNLLQ